MTNTTVTVTYANGTTRKFVASDDMEQKINEGEMFSVTTMHSDISQAEEMSVSKMYAGNPVAALGNMLLMRRNAESLGESDTDAPAIISVLDACISFMTNEISSHQSGMSPVEQSPQLELLDDNRVKCPATSQQCEHYTQPYDGELELCIHPENGDTEHEGNCTGRLCPLCPEGGE